MPSHFRSSCATFTPLAAVMACVAMLALAGCSSPPATFAAPQTAVDSLIAALRANDQRELKRVLGSDSNDLLHSGDDIADETARVEFLQRYDERHDLINDSPDVMTLEVGANKWPLPVPLVNDGEGWYFDAAAGLDEVLSRRIGRNELSTIQVCLAIVDAQREYASRDYAGEGLLQYARRVNSEPGKKNGLYWPTMPDEPPSPLGVLIAQATAEGYIVDGRAVPNQPYHGYVYRILNEQGPAAPGGAMNYLAGTHMIGGFGVVAWPAEYGNSGLKTFIVSHHGVVYERDLGDDTSRIASAMRAFNPEAGWEPSDTAVQIEPNPDE